MSIFCFSDDQDWRKFSVLPVSSFYVTFQGSSAPTCTEVDLRLFFHCGVGRAQYIDTFLWLNAVCEYCDPGSGSHTVTCVFSRYQ